jgi:hypothetical protein
MPPTPEQIKLARRYEPILYFHRDERFFPVDPKRYIEECALWRTRRPSKTKDDWGEEPAGIFPKRSLMPAHGVASMNTPAELAGRKWLGDLLPGASDNQDRFLALGGWADSTSVAQTTQNRHTSLATIRQLYAPASAPPGLANSRFWYYAEILDSTRLSALIEATPAEKTSDLDLNVVFGKLRNPRLIAYHLFYPAHEEPLEGCEGFGEGTQFASFAGEWSCVAVLEEDGAPSRIGLTSRNVGTLDAGDDEIRLGMTVRPWGDVLNVTGQPDHPKVFVARGTHGNYLSTGDTGVHEVKPFSSPLNDLARNSCGQIEVLDDAIAGVETPPHMMGGTGIVIAKVLLGPPGWIWLGIELADSRFGTAPPSPSQQPVDITPGGNQFGTVIAPKGVTVSEPVSGRVVWRTDDAAAPNGEMPTTDGRRYGFIVNRGTQIWWPTRNDRRGYDGRWGHNVDHDPNFRRSGMRTPQFWLMFMMALARAR